jgi:2-polyprenyl-3-methyl-5-hydroxy-6-metoxy-1,4-benzoquinol methylase
LQPPLRCNLCRTSFDAGRSVALRKDGFDILRCPSCGLLCRASMPSAAELAAIYDGGYFRDDPLRPNRDGYADYLSDEPLHRRNARRRLGTLSTYVSGGGRRLLDVGCAAGFFVAEARRQGWPAEGIDVARDMVEWGRVHATPELSTAQFAAFSGTPTAYDIVTMWDYIEHSVDPSADVERAHALLAPGGLLALSTGDVESFVARVTGKRWHLLTPAHHNYFFGRTTLAKLLDRADFELLLMTSEAAWYSTAHLVFKLETLLPLGIGRALAHRLLRSRIGELELPVNLYDIVTIVARKRAYVA